MTTIADQLADAEAARAKILLAQSYRMADGREVTRADLDAVNRIIDTLRPLAAREARGGGISVRLATPRR